MISLFISLFFCCIFFHVGLRRQMRRFDATGHRNTAIKSTAHLGCTRFDRSGREADHVPWFYSCDQKKDWDFKATVFLHARDFLLWSLLNLKTSLALHANLKASSFSRGSEPTESWKPLREEKNTLDKAPLEETLAARSAVEEWLQPNKT